MSLLLASPVKRHIYLSPGLEDGRARWNRTQRFGCTGFSWEPRLGDCAHFHRAIDVARGAAGAGDDLVAAAAGTVIYAGTLNGGGIAVVIRHADGWATGYGHLQSLGCSRGQKVSKGQRIGAVGSTGNSTGPHVHFALKSGFPTTGGVNEFWRDTAAGGRGTWRDPWPHLEQNVKVRPTATCNIRTSPGSGSKLGPLYATAKLGGRITRKSDGADLGATSSWRDWDRTVTGASYSVGGRTSSRWHSIDLPGGTFYVAALLAELSA